MYTYDRCMPIVVQEKPTQHYKAIIPQLNFFFSSTLQIKLCRNKSSYPNYDSIPQEQSLPPKQVTPVGSWQGLFCDKQNLDPVSFSIQHLAAPINIPSLLSQEILWLLKTHVQPKPLATAAGTKFHVLIGLTKPGV